MQKFALIEGKIQNKKKGIFHHKNFKLEKKTGNYINKSIQPQGMCNSHRFLVETQLKREKKQILNLSA